MGDEFPTDVLELYRSVKSFISQIESILSPLKEKLETFVRENGSYKDDTGYVRIAHRDAYTFYPSAKVDDLVTAWKRSPDPIMQSCAEMLASIGDPKDATSYVQIK